MKKILLLPSILLITPLLLSATSGGVYSDIAGKKYTSEVVERVIADSYKTYECKSNGKNGKNISAKIRFDYEYYKMGHGLLYTKWSETYALNYRIKIELMESYEYKKNEFLWISSSHTAYPYLSTVSIKTTFGNTNNDFKVINFQPNTDLHLKPVAYDLDDHGTNEFGTTGGGTSFYDGGYIIPIYHLEEVDKSYLGRNVSYNYSTINSYSQNSYIFNQKEECDVIGGSEFKGDSTYYYFGSINFTTSKDPNNISFDINVVVGGYKNDELNFDKLKDGGSSDKLTKGEVEVLLKKGFTPINSKYNNKTSITDSFTI